MLGIVLLSSAAILPPQDSSSPDENTIKALFIYNFTKQIEWPASNLQGQKFVISVYGDSPVREKLIAVMKGRKVFDKNVEIRLVESMDEITGSQIVFVSQNQSNKLSKINEVCAEKGILIITEEKGMAGKGAAINIVEIESHLRFEMNESAIKKQGLKVSSQLYKLAITIR